MWNDPTAIMGMLMFAASCMLILAITVIAFIDI
jgi:hypothetical protein